MGVRTGAEKRQMIGRSLVSRGQLTEPTPGLDLRPWAGDVQHAAELHVARDRVEESIDRLHSDDAEHLAHILGRIGDVAMLCLQWVWKCHRGSWPAIFLLPSECNPRSLPRSSTRRPRRGLSA